MKLTRKLIIPAIAAGAMLAVGALPASAAISRSATPSATTRTAAPRSSITTDSPNTSVLIWAYAGIHYPNTSKGKSECDTEGIYYVSLGYWGYECYVDPPAPKGDLGLWVAFYGNP